MQDWLVSCRSCLSGLNLYFLDTISFNPGSIPRFLEGNMVFKFACICASAAAYALIVINHKAPIMFIPIIIFFIRQVSRSNAVFNKGFDDNDASRGSYDYFTSDFSKFSSGYVHFFTDRLMLLLHRMRWISRNPGLST